MYACHLMKNSAFNLRKKNFPWRYDAAQWHRCQHLI